MTFGTCLRFCVPGTPKNSIFSLRLKFREHTVSLYKYHTKQFKLILIIRIILCKPLGTLNFFSKLVLKPKCGMKCDNETWFNKVFVLANFVVIGHSKAGPRYFWGSLFKAVLKKCSKIMILRNRRISDKNKWNFKK